MEEDGFFELWEGLSSFLSVRCLVGLTYFFG